MERRNKVQVRGWFIWNPLRQDERTFPERSRREVMLGRVMKYGFGYAQPTCCVIKVQGRKTAGLLDDLYKGFTFPNHAHIFAGVFFKAFLAFF